MGLPANPEPDAPPAAADPAPAGPTTLADIFEPPAQAGFYNHQQCPPGHRGCVLTRTVTDDAVTTTLSCPGGSSFGGTHALRKLAITNLVVEAADTDFNRAPDAALTRTQFRVPLLRTRQQLRTCFRDAPTATKTELEMHALLLPTGAFFALDVTNAPRVSPAVATCVVDVLHNAVRFPAAPTSTRARWRFEYTAEDPNAYVTPLDCP